MNQSRELIQICILILGFTTHQSSATPPPDVAAEAKLIADSNRAELIVMRIFPFRNPDERKKINDMVRQKGVTPLIDDKYMPVAPGSIPYLDLCFVLLNSDKITILSRYIFSFLKAKDETLITIIMLLVDRMDDFTKACHCIDKDGFDDACEDQRKPYRNMLRVWLESNRPPDCAADQTAVDKEACTLLDEKPKWDDDRDQLEKVLMKSSYAMAKAILTKYEEKNKHPIEDDIKAIIKNADLVDAYSSLASYIKNKYKCLATKLHEHSDSNDNWTVWNILIGILKPDEWKQIDTEFKKDNDNIGVVEFISKNILGDFVLMETFAYLIDQNYKPQFLDVPAPIATPATSPPKPAPSGPPVPPTCVVPPMQAPIATPAAPPAQPAPSGPPVPPNCVVPPMQPPQPPSLSG
ncbi:uncharacterized protein LOC135848486 [Planococcus citri]|uniref:uncharacterized protein LOC135848486 n=1 Tax=Planococcus citri TaxID=170843 RepID=UPI0031FA475D